MKPAAQSSSYAEAQADKRARGTAELAGIDLAAILQLPERPRGRGKAAQLQAVRLRGGQEGTLRTRGDWWCVQFRGAKGENGKRRQHLVRVGRIADMTRDQAHDARLRLLEQIAPRPPIAGATCAWVAWCGHFHAVYVPTLKHGSQRTVTSIIRRHLLPAFNGLQVHEIRNARIQAGIAKWLRDGAAPATIRARYRTLYRMLKKARSEGYSAELPQPGDIELPRGSAVRARGGSRAFTMDELQQILAAATMPWRLLYLLCTYLGLRMGEVLGLRWADIDLQRGRICLVRQYTRGRADVSPKTTSSAADITLPELVLFELRAYQATRPAGDVYVFQSPRTGRPFDDSGVRKRHLRPLLKRLGIAPGRSVHAFRHAFGTEAARAGVPLPQLGKAMRHGDQRSTQQYANMQAEDGAAAQAAVVSRYSLAGVGVLSGADARNGEKQAECVTAQELADASGAQAEKS